MIEIVSLDMPFLSDTGELCDKKNHFFGLNVIIMLKHSIVKPMKSQGVKYFNI